MKLLCECGHWQVLHMGPYGNCRGLIESTIETADTVCSCAGFVLETRVAPELERDRADLA